MTKAPESQYEGADPGAVRPYLIVSDANTAIEFYQRAFDATELERHTTPSGGVGHAKIRIGETILEVGEQSECNGA